MSFVPTAPAPAPHVPKARLARQDPLAAHFALLVLRVLMACSPLLAILKLLPALPVLLDRSAPLQEALIALRVPRALTLHLHLAPASTALLVSRVSMVP